MSLSAVLALHGAVAADGDAADGVQSLAHLLFPDGGTHKHGKFVDLNAGELGGSKMPQLMDENQDAEQENRKNITLIRTNASQLSRVRPNRLTSQTVGFQNLLQSGVGD